MEAEGGVNSLLDSSASSPAQMHGYSRLDATLAGISITYFSRVSKIWSEWKLVRMQFACSRRSIPKMARHETVYNRSIEEAIGDLATRDFDVVFTMSVLAHIHPQSEWVVPEIVRITRATLIAIENEFADSWRAFPRNHRRIFERLGMKRVEELSCEDMEGLGAHFVARVFQRVR